MKKRKKIFYIILFFSLVMWTIDSVLDFLFFYKGTFWELLLFKVPPHELYIRSFLLISFLIFAFILSKVYGKLKIEEKKANELDIKYNYLFNTLNEAIILHEINEGDSPGRIVEVNNKATEMLGYSRQDFKKLTIDDIDFDMQKKDRSVIMDNLLKKGSLQFEQKHQTKNGDVIPVEINSKVIKIKEKKYIISAIRDISERKKNIRLQNRLASIVENSGDAIIGNDLEGNIRTWNNGAESIYGYKKKEVVGKNISILIPDTEKFNAEEILEKIKEDKTIKIQKTKRITKSGKEIFVSLTVSPIKNEKNKIIGVSGIARDITQQIKNEKHIKHLNQVLRSIRNINQLIVQNSDKEKLLQEACKKLVSKRGYSTAWILMVESNKVDDFYSYGFNINKEKIINKLNSTGLCNCLKKTLDTKDVIKIDKELSCKTGCILYSNKLSENLMLKKLSYEASIYGIMGVSIPEQIKIDEDEINLYAEMVDDLAFALHDINLQKEKEEMKKRLIKSQKMEAIGNLAGGIAHDFNNLLFAIMGNLELIKNISDNRKINKYLSKAIKSGNRAKELISQILTFSKEELEGKENVKIVDVIREVLEFVENTIPSNINIIKDIERVDSFIYANPVNIHQICMNLITNSYQAMPEEGGRIYIQLKEKYLKDNNKFNIKSGKYVILTVEDTGKGIEKNKLTKIFEPYFTTKNKNGGTGLGLSLVYNIVKDLDGDIVVKSKVNEGSKFTVILPIEKNIIGKNKIKSAEKNKQVKKKRYRLIYVDDETSLTEMLSEVLENYGCIVDTFNDPQKALKFIKNNYGKYDALIFDQTMPKLTGLKLAEKIKKIDGDIPIFILSGYSDVIKEKQIKDLNIKKYLYKPIDFYKLYREIYNTLES